MEEITDYPSLVDAVWKVIQEMPEDKDQVDLTFTEEQIAGVLGIFCVWDSDARIFGIAQAISDLVY